MGKAFYTGRYDIDRSGILNFWRNRALRVFPLYYFSLLITSLLVYTNLFRFENWEYLLRIITFRYDQTLPIAFNGALWTLSTEVQFYFFVPFIFRTFQNRLRDKRQVLYLALGIILGSFVCRWILWLIVQANFQPPEDAIAFVRYIYVPIWMNIDVFLCGFLLNYWINDKQLSSRKLTLPTSLLKWKRRSYLILKSWKQRQFRTRIHDQFDLKSISMVLLLLLYVSTAYLKYYHPDILGLISPTVTLLTTCVFIYAFEKHSESKNTDRRNCKLSLKACQNNPWRILEVLGVLSYGIYIWHLPILAKIQPFLTSNIPIQAYFYRLSVTLILSTFLAAMTYYLIEVPTANLKKIKPRSHLQK
jgi:peptidoglycan/LPS O-acetylase OafA/YrhL